MVRQWIRPTTLILIVGVFVLIVIFVTVFSNGILSRAPSAYLTSNVSGSLASAPQEAQFYGAEREEAVDAAPNQLAGEQQRVILKTASLNLIVESAESALASITSMTDEMGGWVVSSTTSMVTMADGTEVARGSITIRIPAERLDEALTRIKSGGGEVDSESVTGQDVTQQYVDLTSRLTNLEAAEAQLRTIMEGATRTEDVMAVFQQLVQVRSELEVVRGQIQYYAESAAYSSVTVNLTPKAIDTPIQIAGWSPGRTVERALASLVNLLRGLADIVITVVIVGIPLVLMIGIPGWLAWRTFKRFNRQAAR
ncbi:MAG: DUF4349 domain-containing protein [Anaerolineae bacterium]|nr:DUF4349 domain-containing protein [Anaerolineae bacterium]